MITLKPISDSSQVMGVAHAGDSLYVLYRANQKLYRYLDVPRSVYSEFLAAPSKGKFLNADVKKRFKFELVSDEYQLGFAVNPRSLAELLPGPGGGW